MCRSERGALPIEFEVGRCSGGEDVCSYGFSMGTVSGSRAVMKCEPAIGWWRRGCLTEEVALRRSCGRDRSGSFPGPGTRRAGMQTSVLQGPCWYSDQEVSWPAGALSVMTKSWAAESRSRVECQELANMTKRGLLQCLVAEQCRSIPTSFPSVISHQKRSAGAPDHQHFFSVMPHILSSALKVCLCFLLSGSLSRPLRRCSKFPHQANKSFVMNDNCASRAFAIYWKLSLVG